MSTSLLAEVVDTFGLPETPKSGDIDQDRVKVWMNSDDIEVLGALHTFMSKGEYLDRVKPSLSRAELSEFFFRYYERCLRENHEGAWADSRYGAAWDVAAWFKGLWNRGPSERDLQDEIKNWLAALYLNGDERLRRCIVDGALEHMFEEKGVRAHFADWRKDTRLAIAYMEACQWVDGQRRTRR